MLLSFFFFIYSVGSVKLNAWVPKSYSNRYASRPPLSDALALGVGASLGRGSLSEFCHPPTENKDHVFCMGSALRILYAFADARIESSSSFCSRTRSLSGGDGGVHDHSEVSCIEPGMFDK